MDPIAVGMTFEHVCEFEKDKEGNPKENATVWIIGPIDSLEKTMIVISQSNAKLVDDNLVMDNSGSFKSQDFAILAHGLKGWRNFGNVEFRTEKVKLFDREVDVVPMDLLKIIPLPAIHELADKIWSDNTTISEEQEKN